jgi:D-glucosaminate-6-phosphate ammonia-lyase
LTSVSVTAWMMQPGDDKIVAERLHAALSRRRDPRSTAAAAPAANIAGQWDVDIEFYSSRSRHTFLVHQDGTWLEGSHQGDFTARDLAGTIEGTQVKVRSMERLPGSAVPFIFAGTLTGDTMAGDVYMGEYLNAKFTARRHTYNAPRAPIRVPSGRPLAT